MYILTYSSGNLSTIQLGHDFNPKIENYGDAQLGSKLNMMCLTLAAYLIFSKKYTSWWYR